jgi:3-dehydroquinate synthase
MTTVRVDLGERGYDVVIESSLDALTRATRGFRKVAVVTQVEVERQVGGRVAQALDGVDYETFYMSDGEDAKTISTIEALCRGFARCGLLRGDVLVAVGGGVVGDTGGFAAAVYHRGIALVQVPTTLLAMVDSAIGGKTGVNLPEGKNLVGAFHQPLAVCADVRALDSLPDREYRCGLGEVAKYALIENLTIDSEKLAGRDPDAQLDAITTCASIKARYVAEDELEQSGARMTLNYGHTLAHALEVASQHTLLHGEAVGIGLVFAGQLAGALERIDREAVDRHEAVVASLGLPVTAPPGLRADDVLPLMARDKKSGGRLTFVLAGPSGIEKVDDADASAVYKALAAVGITE